ncbi:MAG: GNAT family N-acetyltransferase [Caldilineaceae bacterium]|nr:GNAT family N-acetyltransferase [Caldilineaceae bacterium]
MMALGASPARQGQGIGGALMQPLLLQAGQEQTPCYLETFAERNLAFYVQQGFEVTDKSRVKDGPVFWGMVRHPS